MAAAPGIAGSRAPEQDGCFLCLTEHEVDWFLGMNNTGGTADVWAVEGVPQEALVESPEGHYFVPYAIPPDRLELLQEDVEPRWALD